MEKKFSKLKIFQIIGVVQGDYDDRIHRIKRKPVFYLRSLAILLLTNGVLIKIIVSSLFIDQDHPSQFFLASWFNFLKQDGYQSARFYVGLAGEYRTLLTKVCLLIIVILINESTKLGMVIC